MSALLTRTLLRSLVLWRNPKKCIAYVSHVLRWHDSCEGGQSPGNPGLAIAAMPRSMTISSTWAQANIAGVALPVDRNRLSIVRH